MLRLGTQMTLACVSSASATHTRACAAATISGRASERRSAVARLIGKRRSVGANGGALSLGVVASGERGVADDAGKAGGKARVPGTSAGAAVGWAEHGWAPA